LIGVTAVNNPTFKDHHFLALDIGQVMAASGISNLTSITEDIEIGFYSKSAIELKDSSGGMRTAFSAAAKPA
jgi:hypothetical protein